MTADLTCLRIGKENDGLTQGVLLKDGLAFAVTLELDWKENAQNESRIPAGRYTCKRVKSPRFGETFEITGVTGRTHVLFHRGNTIPDTKGCVLVGEKYVDLGIGESGNGFDELMKKFEGRDEFTYEIIEYFTDEKIAA